MTEGLSPEQRDAVILEHVGLVNALARRYANRGEPLDDLVQVGMIGLIKAVDRFDPSMGVNLVGFATPTILGEIRRHFRDRSWAMHVPRSVKDAHVRVNRTTDDLTARLHRSPTIREIGEATDLTEEEVLDAIAAGRAYQPMSLSGAPGIDEDEPIDVGVVEEGYERVEGRVALGVRLRELPEREQRILVLRFHEGLTQSQIARRVGISQMHVSRLIAKALATLRESVGRP